MKKRRFFPLLAIILLVAAYSAYLNIDTISVAVNPSNGITKLKENIAEFKSASIEAYIESSGGSQQSGALPVSLHSIILIDRDSGDFSIKLNQASGSEYDFELLKTGDMLSIKVPMVSEEPFTTTIDNPENKPGTNPLDSILKFLADNGSVSVKRVSSELTSRLQGYKDRNEWCWNIYMKMDGQKLHDNLIKDLPSAGTEDGKDSALSGLVPGTDDILASLGNYDIVFQIVLTEEFSPKVFEISAYDKSTKENLLSVSGTIALSSEKIVIK